MTKLQTEFFIAGNTPSSKNGRRLVKGGKFIGSKPTMKWRKNTDAIFEAEKAAFIKAVKKKKKPLRIGFFFIRDSRRKFDLHNAIQIVADAMVYHGWIVDDNAEEFVPVFLEIDGAYFKVDKSNAGCIIRVL